MQATQSVQRTSRTTPRRSEEDMKVIRSRRGKLNKVQREARHNWESAE